MEIHAIQPLSPISWGIRPPDRLYPIRIQGEDTDRREESDAKSTSKTKRSYDELSVEEQNQVRQLQVIDKSVRAHEQAHVIAGGQYVTQPASFKYEIGPDGQRYAIAGEVKIDTSPVPNDPQATINKARTIARAALAPADPSPQDYSVASQARLMEAQARRELMQVRLDGIQAGADERPNITPAAKQSGFPDVQSLQAALIERINTMFPSTNTPGFYISMMV